MLWILVGLPAEFIQEAALAFDYEVRDKEVKQSLLMSSEVSLMEALNQAMNVEVAKAAAGRPARLTMKPVMGVIYNRCFGQL